MSYDKERYAKPSFLINREIDERYAELAVELGVNKSQLYVKGAREYMRFLVDHKQQNNSNTSLDSLV